MRCTPHEARSELATDLIDFIRQRRSVRRYRAEAPSKEVLQRVLLCAGAAPSAHNRQPWRYLIVDDATAKAKLAEAMGKRLAEDRKRDGDSDEVVNKDVLRSYERVTTAPVVVVIAAALEDMDKYNDSKRVRAEFLMAVQSTAMATQNLLLAAFAEGLGSCWMCAPLFCQDVVRDTLNLKPTWIPQGLVTLGYPAEPSRQRTRLEFGQFVEFYSPACRQSHD